LFAFCCVPSWAAQSPTLFDNTVSYGDLASLSMAKYLPVFLQQLPTLNANSSAGGVNVLRKSALYVRDLLDLFCFAYPLSDPDLWTLARKNMNDGYTVLGDFQNLNHSAINYTQAQYQHLLNKTLEWQADFYALNNTDNIVQYLLLNNLTQIYERNISTLSEFFWQIVPFPLFYNVTDTNYTSGYSLLTYLTNALLQMAEDRYWPVYNLTDITVPSEHTEFHDYRKLIRAINALTAFYPLIVMNNNTNNSLNLLLAVYNNFGDTNDVVTAYLFYRDHRAPWNETETARLNSIISWAELRLWMLNNSIVDQYLLLQQSFVFPFSPVPTPPPDPVPLLLAAPELNKTRKLVS